jgi:alpha-glucosidase
MPRADPVDRGCARVRLQRHRGEWLPQPAEWAALARDVQEGDPDSTLWLYRTLLATRRAEGLGAGARVARRLRRRRHRVPQRECDRDRERVGCPGPLPSGTVLVASEPFDGGALPVDVAVWMLAD